MAIGSCMTTPPAYKNKTTEKTPGKATGLTTDIIKILSEIGIYKKVSSQENQEMAVLVPKSVMPKNY